MAGLEASDGEATSLLVSERSTDAPVGIVLLHETPLAAQAVEIRLGYLLAEHAWGRGLGGELVDGLVRWCRKEPVIRSVVGGVERGNLASIRILERNGFVRVDQVSDPDDGW